MTPREIEDALGRRGWFAQGGRAVVEPHPSMDAYRITMEMPSWHNARATYELSGVEAEQLTPNEVADRAIRFLSEEHMRAAFEAAAEPPATTECFNGNEFLKRALPMPAELPPLTEQVRREIWRPLGVEPPSAESGPGIAALDLAPKQPDYSGWADETDLLEDEK